MIVCIDTNSPVRLFGKKSRFRFIKAAEHGKTILVLRNGKRVARLTPKPLQTTARASHRRISAADLDVWIEGEQSFFDSMLGKVHGKPAVRALQESRR